METFKKKPRNKRYIQNYEHESLYPGAVFSTKSNGECTVLGRSEDKSRRGYYVVKFRETGVIKEAYGSHIKSGSVSDEAFPSTEEERLALLMKPKYYGVGYIGIGPHSTIENVRSHQRTRAFILWHNMIARCYMTKQGKQMFSGYKGVTVCERWHNFQYFCNDLPALHGYKSWRDNPGEFELDKDYSHRRIYSPDTVAFISKSDNAREAGLRASAMKISRKDYHVLNKMREDILLDAEDELNKAGIIYEVVLNGTTHIILTETPYGTAVFYPLTRTIQRHCYMIQGGIEKYIEYLNWLTKRWEDRNFSTNCIAAKI